MNDAKKIRILLKAINEKCLNCCCFQKKEVELCPSENCPLHKFRNGEFDLPLVATKTTKNDGEIKKPNFNKLDKMFEDF